MICRPLLVLLPLALALQMFETGLSESVELLQRQAPKRPVGQAPWYPYPEQVRKKRRKHLLSEDFVPESDLGLLPHIISFGSLNYPAKWGDHCQFIDEEVEA